MSSIAFHEPEVNNYPIGTFAIVKPMIPVLVSLAAVSAAELLLWTPVLWSARKIFSRFLIVLLIVASGALIVERFNLLTVLLAFLSGYRCFNLARTAAGRIQPDYLFHASKMTSFWLIGSQLVLVAAAGLYHYQQANPMLLWYALAGFELVAAAVLLASTLRHLRTTKKPPLGIQDSGQELPSLTVAIPARNETTDLEECLQSLSASTYPKLEIIVLDDCSQNKRTPEIIRSFAHAGIQFIAGTTPSDSWLAKNHAYAQLAEAANGELLLFCGVDTRFEPDSLSVLVRTLLQKNKKMLSILPGNVRPKSSDVISWIIQPNRYAWELGLPRRLLQRPPVLSTCWLITREALQAAGGFQAVRRKGVPESYFARTIAGAEDGYSFLQSDKDIGLSSRKLPEEQKATAIRTRYLQLHRRPELVALIGLLEFTALSLPLVLFLAALANGEWALAAMAGSSLLITMVAYGKIVNLTYRGFTLKGVWLSPIAALYDIGLLNYSMWLYEFREVLWKGRNVCIPVMRVFPNMPEA